MTKLKRHILVATLFATFAVVAPLVLSFASGYSYNWRKNTIEKTGIIRVDTEPSGATVLVNGKRASKTAPVSVPRLLPEEYVVEIELDGYLPWRKTLIVESGRTTFAKTVNLIKDMLPRLILRKDIIESVFSQDGAAIAYISRDEQWAELAHRDFRTGQSLLLSRFGAEKYSDVSLSLSPDGSRLMMNAVLSKENERVIDIYEISLTGTAKAINDLPAKSDLHFCWTENADAVLATDTKMMIVRDEQEPQTLFATSKDTIRDLHCTKDNYWLLIETEAGLNLTKIPQDKPLAPEVVKTFRVDERRFVSGKNDLLWLSGDGLSGGLALNPQEDSSFRTPEATGIEWEYAGENGRVLLWNDFEIFLIDFVKPEPELITRLGTPILDVAWHPDGSYALFVTGTGVTAIDLDSRDRRNIFRLVEFGAVDSMSIYEESSLLRFVGSIGNQRGIYERPL